MHTNDHDPKHVKDSEHPGYEVTDINVGSILVFLAGLFGTVLVFFVLCFGIGKEINNGLKTSDGASDQWHKQPAMEGGRLANGNLDNLASNPKIEQQQLQALTTQFPQPRLEADDGNQDITDLHTREDLLLDHYSTIEGKAGAVRIPIDRAMELIAQRGLPTAPQAAASTELTGAKTASVRAPLTSGFARTGYELDAMEAREQKMKYAEPGTGTKE